MATILAQALAEQTLLLQQILARLDRPQLGFHDGAGAMRVYANRSNGGLWYTVVDNQVQLIPHTALTGYLTDISFPKVERRGKECIKLQITLQGDRPYLIEAGHDSHFSKGFLSAVALLIPAQVQTPVTISPQAGEDDSVLFCRLFSGGQLVKASYDDETDWRLVAKAAIAAVRNGQPH
ncbi:hypothetical protein H6G02_17380 [Leptolyngbya sp. FACHB-16]|nr:hypothetical protein [Leptolyngbya sp. FACHB-16]